MKTVTLQGFVGALYELSGDELRRVHRAALGRYAREVQGLAVARLVQRGVARRLWGGASAKARGGARKMLRVSAVRRGADEDYVSLTAIGLAAMTEAGGRTAAHAIRAKREAALRLPDSGFARGRGVQHPGGPVPAQPWLLPTIEETEGLLVAQINAGSERVIGRLFGG